MKSLPKFELIAATRSHKSILADLLQLYIEEFSAFVTVPVGLDGRFVYKNLPSYLTEPAVILFSSASARNGPALSLSTRFRSLRPQSSREENCWDMAEFFVLDKYRRRGLGSNVAHAVWRAFPGRWEVRVMEWHKAAHVFWSESIAGFAGRKVASTPIEAHGRKWRVFAFDSPAAQSGRPRKR